MPYEGWIHYCPVKECEMTLGTPVCSECGQPGQCDGWHLGRIELMRAYSRRTGLQPMGEHRPLADLILDPLLTSCPCCDGRGLIDDGHEPWPSCPECDGSQYVPAIDKAEFVAARRRLLKEYPDAANCSTQWD
jgi:hypothetical protein